VIVRFVAIGGSVDHHCLNLLVTIFLNVGTIIMCIYTKLYVWENNYPREVSEIVCQQNKDSKSITKHNNQTQNLTINY
jgi:hypothetical protein